uniref:Uncharacterized protein n=1 Tax=Oryza meridionalis TaxID=40149 RepID=A0A1Y8Z4M9_9ORYZ
MLDFLPH